MKTSKPKSKRKSRVKKVEPPMVAVKTEPETTTEILTERGESAAINHIVEVKLVKKVAVKPDVIKPYRHPDGDAPTNPTLRTRDQAGGSNEQV